MESADGNMDLVRKALATGLLLNAARLTGTSVISDRDAGNHEYELLRGSGECRSPALAVLQVNMLFHIRSRTTWTCTVGM